MKDEIRPIKTPKINPVNSRPFFLTLISLFSWVFFGLLSILFLTGIFWSAWVTRVTNHYIPSETWSVTQVRLIFAAGFLLHLLAFTGIILTWNMKKTGYYLLAISCLVIAAAQSLQPQIAASATALYILFILAFGIFYRKFI